MGHVYVTNCTAPSRSVLPNPLVGFTPQPAGGAPIGGSLLVLYRSFAVEEIYGVVVFVGVMMGGRECLGECGVLQFFPFLFAFAVGGHGFELCVCIAGWRRAHQSEWPFIINLLLLLS